MNVDRIAAQFFSSETGDAPVAPSSDDRAAAISPLISSEYDPAEWGGFDSCFVCIREWCVDYPGPCFVAPVSIGERIIDTLSVSVTTLGAATYGIKATGYLYDGRSGAYIGMIDLRYFGDNMPRTLTFDLAQHRLPVSTWIEVRFAVDGGGTPRIPKPPTVNSVSLRLTAR